MHHPSHLIASAISTIFLSAGAIPVQAADASLPLVFHAETIDGRVVESRGAEISFNPASVVKVATTLWALERLGPEYRFETEFVAVGDLDVKSGVLAGDLVVRGGGDPDFHAENVFLVAEALRHQGIREISGQLRLEGDAWIGWEGGSARRIEDPRERRQEMTARFARAFDPTRWTKAEQTAWGEMNARREMDDGSAAKATIQDPAFTGLVFRGHVFKKVEDPSWDKKPTATVVHRSNPLKTILRRLNAYSNNDIERLGAHLGSTSAMEAFVASSLAEPVESISFSTLSGLGRNRLSPRAVVSLLGKLREMGQRQGFELSDVLPRAGCDPGTLRNYPGLTDEDLVSSVVAKTGTLTTTDQGVSVLAGFAATAEGEITFSAAAPRSGGHLREARSQKEAWLLHLIGSQGGPKPQPCPPPLPYSDSAAIVLAPS